MTKLALQVAVAQLAPEQVQYQGPIPVTAEAVSPTVQRLVVGATGKLPPLEDPQIQLVKGLTTIELGKKLSYILTNVSVG